MSGASAMEIITVDDWPHIFRQLRPADDAHGANSERLRGRVNEILFVFGAERSAAKSSQPAFDFGEFAEFGRRFLTGVHMGHAFLNVALGSLSTNPHRGSAGIIPDQRDTAAIEKQIAMLAGLQAIIDGIGADSEGSAKAKAGPNAKPWLHSAVADLRLLWQDEGQSNRPKKDFLQFAEDLIGGVFGVTASSILESFDRHCHRLVAERLAKREEWQNSPSA